MENERQLEQNRVDQVVKEIQKQQKQTEKEYKKAHEETSSVEKTMYKMPKSTRLKLTIGWKQMLKFNSKSN